MRLNTLTTYALTHLSIIFLPLCTQASTTMIAGDIAFLGMNLESSGNDDFSFVLLKDIDGSTQISFTDRGWHDNTGLFTVSGDSTITWTSGSNLSAGTVIQITTAQNGTSTLPFASTGTVSGARMVLSNIGDQMFAYTGSGSAESDLIAGMHSNNHQNAATIGNWDGVASSNSTSMLPNSWTNGNQGIWLNSGGSEQDNWRFNANSASVTSGTPEEIRAIVHNINNWTPNDSSAVDQTPSNFGTFNVTTVPEPTSLVLLSTGVMSLLLRRKK